MPKYRTFVARSIPWLIVCGFGAAAVYVLLATTEWMWGPLTCVTLVAEGFSKPVSGYDFEVSRTINCDVAMNVLVSREGQREKTLLFKFIPPDKAAIPGITAIDRDTVQISIPSVPYIFCRKDKWQTLVVKYDIGVIGYRTGGTDEC